MSSTARTGTTSSRAAPATTGSTAGQEQFDGATFWSSPGGVVGSLADGTATGPHGTDTFTNVEELHGSDYADTFYGSPGDDGLLGLGGNDLLVGGDGNDSLQGIQATTGSSAATGTTG